MVAVACASAVAGAVYGLVSFPETPLFSVLRGTITGAAISAMITAFEFAIGTGVLQPIRRLPVGLLVADLKRKRPGTHYLLEDGFNNLDAHVQQLLDEVNPESFKRDRSYRRLVIERA